MFDEQNTNKEPVDIFQKTDPVVKPEPGAAPVLPPNTPPAAGNPLPTQPVPASRSLVVAAIVVVIVVVVLIAVLVGFWLVRRGQPVTTTPESTDVETTETPEPEFESSVQELLQDDDPEEPIIVDTDRDGLTDEQENELGTSIIVDDSDGDGLSDGEEVNTWKTDPLVPDTDGDGFLDGAEVSQSYDPLQGGGARLDTFDEATE